MNYIRRPCRTHSWNNRRTDKTTLKMHRCCGPAPTGGHQASTQHPRHGPPHRLIQDRAHCSTRHATALCCYTHTTQHTKSLRSRHTTVPAPTVVHITAHSFAVHVNEIGVPDEHVPNVAGLCVPALQKSEGIAPSSIVSIVPLHIPPPTVVHVTAQAEHSTFNSAPVV